MKDSGQPSRVAPLFSYLLFFAIFFAIWHVVKSHAGVVGVQNH
jgi:hypothetical protein